MELTQIGFNETIKEAFEMVAKENQIIGRISLEHKRMYRVWTEYGELLCEVSGKLAYTAQSREELPAVGDWVIVSPRILEEKGTIINILPRVSKFSRKVAGNSTEEQIVAANVDTIFLVNSLNEDLNIRRIERYLTLTWESGASPVIVLTKADLVDDISEKVTLVESVAFGIPIIVVSIVNNIGLETLKTFLSPGKTVALLGSSGVGKSTLTNYLCGYNKQEVQGIRESDAKGRHTTTNREMVLLPNSAVLIDTPGMRELQLWNSEEGISNSFSEIEEFAAYCKFRDCQHEKEIGCAVKLAIENGKIEEERLLSYKKLLRELAFLERRQDKKAQSDQKKIWKNRNKQFKKK
ncbi:ribosome small subunit-dependent GTPase A [Niallia circulans]|uniref:ribosome small subunit-dependent GTPase A n=1 Tax=Niallia circulans TaxID=1397 RepID=UPI000BA7C544|nr:ribosome small subunit-dependent GTPase A [Niallia circulans]PAE12028.1 ribosome small subunit-dependent GTPase A [Niallia circulans]